jgi:hypothetical protein
MELKTESGVSITIIEEGSSRILIFDRSVRAVELNEDETAKISTVLSSNLKARRFASNTDLTKTQNDRGATLEGR